MYRKINLMRSRSIQKSDGSREEAVLVGWYRFQTFVSFSRRKKVKERTSREHGVFNYAGCFSKAAGSVDSINGWEAALRDGLGFYSSLWSWAEQEPYQAVIQLERMFSMVHL